jgi:hypothetical protein
VAPVVSPAQIVYSVGVYKMGQTHERDWTVGSGNARFGFDQYRQAQDASGRNLHRFSDVTARGVASLRYTTVYAGPFTFTIRGPAWIAALVVAVAAGSLFFLVVSAGRLGDIKHVHTPA